MFEQVIEIRILEGFAWLQFDTNAFKVKRECECHLDCPPTATPPPPEHHLTSVYPFTRRYVSDPHIESVDECRTFLWGKSYVTMKLPTMNEGKMWEEGVPVDGTVMLLKRYTQHGEVWKIVPYWGTDSPRVRAPYQIVSIAKFTLR